MIRANNIYYMSANDNLYDTPYNIIIQFENM